MKNKEKMIVPKLRFKEFELDPSWELFKLGNLTKPVTEKTNGKPYTLMSVTSGEGLVSQVEKFGREIAGNSYKNYYVIQENDFAYNKSATKLYPEGYIAMLQGQENAALPNSIFTCFRFIDNDTYVKYFDHLFYSNYHGKWLKQYITVGARANGALAVDNKHLWNMPIALPTKREEQQKIADCLTSLDKLITAENKKLELLKDHKKGLMQKLFPAEGKTMPEWRFPEFRNSEAWESTTLGKIVNYENGKAHENDIDMNGAYIVANSKFISTNGEVKKYTNTPSLLAEKSDILMVLSDVPNGKAIAKCYYVDFDNRYTVNQRICKLTTKNDVPLFLFNIIDRNSYFLKFDDGVKQTNLKKDDVLACPLIVPKDKKEQQKISDCLSSVDILISEQSKKIEQLKEHKKGLMQGLFPSVEEIE